MIYFPNTFPKLLTVIKSKKLQLEDLRKQQIQTTKDSIQAQIDDANNTKIQTAKIRGIWFEIQTLKDIADAKNCYGCGLETSK